MKTTLFIIASILILGACKPDKQAELIKLKKEQQALASKILTLETELANDPAAPKPAENLTTVAIKELKLEPFTHYIEVQGKLDGEENVMLFPKAPGSVVKVFSKVGDRVSKGQIIAQLDDAAYQKNLDQIRSNYELAKEMYDRQSRLWEQKIGSEVQYLQSKTQKESLESALAALEEQIDLMKIKSPINGTIEDLTLKVGQGVSPAMPVATVINFSTIKVVADIAEAYGTNIAPGDSVTLYFPDLKIEEKATISSASKFINLANRSFKVEVRLHGKNDNYKANMITIVKIADYNKPKAISLPINLIQTDGKGNYVYTIAIENGKNCARKKYIKLGMSYNGIMEITEGLTEGDKIISSGHLGLTEGTLISF